MPVLCPGTPLPADQQPLEEITGPDGQWTARAIPNRYPMFAPAADVTCRHEVLILCRDHHADLATACYDAIATGLTLIGRRLAAHRADGWPAVLAWCNVGTDAGASQPHLHAQVLATSLIPPALAAETAAENCPLCLPDKHAGPRRVVTVGTIRVWVPAAPLSAHEIRLAPTTTHHHDELEGPGSQTDPAVTADLAVALQWTLRAARAELGEVGYNVLWHPAPTGTSLHPHLHLLPRAWAPAGCSLATGWLRPPVPAGEWAARLRRHLPV